MKTHAFDFEKLLAESANVHGHLCPGQVLGVNMSILGLREIGTVDPKGKDGKSVTVFLKTKSMSRMEVG